MSGGRWVNQRRIDYLEDRIAHLEVALREIQCNEGKVCDHYEICEHRACQSSYAAWAIADAALRVEQ